MERIEVSRKLTGAGTPLVPALSDVEALHRALQKTGYSTETVWVYTRACVRFVEWSCRARRHPRYIDGSGISQFMKTHLARCHCVPPCPEAHSTHAALNHLRKVVENRLGCSEKDGCEVYPPHVNAELRTFQQYLEGVCGVAIATQTYRLRYVGEFLHDLFANGEIAPSLITSLRVYKYICSRVQRCKAGTASVIAGSIKSYLKYLVLQGKLSSSLLYSIPRIPNWRLSSCPAVLSDAEVRDLLAAFDQGKASEKRDLAMALCMLDLGLRAGEVAGLTVEDLDPHAMTVLVRRTKSRRDRELPLSAGCGKAILAYLRKGRPASAHPQLFLRHTVPVGTPMNTENVRGAMRRAYARAGFPETWTGTHLLRHTAATRIQSAGASLKEIADVLGHQSIDTTMIYTKLDLRALQTVALPWPEAAI